MEQIYLGMGTYDGLGRMKLRAALRRANRISKTNQASSSSNSPALIGDNAEVVQLLVRASEQYSQVWFLSISHHWYICMHVWPLR